MSRLRTHLAPETELLLEEIGEERLHPVQLADGKGQQSSGAVIARESFKFFNFADDEIATVGETLR